MKQSEFICIIYRLIISDYNTLVVRKVRETYLELLFRRKASKYIKPLKTGINLRTYMYGDWEIGVIE